MSIGLPSLEIAFKAAAQEVLARSKRSIVAVLLRDERARGITVMTSAKQIPVDLGKANQEYLARAFLGSDRGTPAKVIVAVVPAVAEGEESNLSEGLALLASQEVDYLAAPPDVTEEECLLVANWVGEQRGKYRTVKTVLPHTAAGSMGVVNFETDGIQVGTVTYTAAEYASRIAGVLAGIPTEGSATFAPLAEVTGLPYMSEEDQNKAIDAGKLILIHDGRQAKIARGVNSLTTVPAEGSEDWKKIKVVESMDLVTYFIRSTIEDKYCGQYNNTYANKLNLSVIVGEFLAELEQKGVLKAGTSWADIGVEAQTEWLRSHGYDTENMTAQELREADTGSFVAQDFGGKFVDAMEDFRANFTNL